MAPPRPLLIVNPASGKLAGGRSLARFADAVERVLGDVDFEVTKRRGHAIDLAREGVVEGRETIVAVGGDGTLHEVVNGVMQARPAAGDTPAAALSSRLWDPGSGSSASARAATSRAVWGSGAASTTTWRRSPPGAPGRSTCCASAFAITPVGP